MCNFAWQTGSVFCPRFVLIYYTPTTKYVQQQALSILFKNINNERQFYSNIRVYTYLHTPEYNDSPCLSRCKDRFPRKCVRYTSPQSPVYRVGENQFKVLPIIQYAVLFRTVINRFQTFKFCPQVSCSCHLYTFCTPLRSYFELKIFKFHFYSFTDGGC